MVLISVTDSPAIHSWWLWFWAEEFALKERDYSKCCNIFMHMKILSVPLASNFFHWNVKNTIKLHLKKKKKKEGCQYKPNSFAKIISQPFIFLISISPTSSCTDRKILIKEEIRLVSIKREINIYFINWKEKKKKKIRFNNTLFMVLFDLFSDVVHCSHLSGYLWSLENLINK